MEDNNNNIVTKKELQAVKEELLHKMEQHATKKELQAVKEELLHKMEQHATKKDLTKVAQDVSVLKQDVSVLKQDVSVLKQDVNMLKKGQELLTTKVDKNSDDISKILTNYINFKEDVHENMVTRREFDEKFSLVLTGQDRLLKLLETMRLEMRVQDVTSKRIKKDINTEQHRNDTQDEILNDHNVRLTKLEIPTS